MDTAQKSGVYRIRNTVTEKVYIGSSVNMPSRWKKHLYALRRGIHYNPKLQNSFNKQGESAFEFGVLQYEPDRSRLTGLEDHFIEVLKPFYNCQKASVTGRVNPGLDFRGRISLALKGRKLGEEHKRKIGEAHRGVKRSPEACANIGASTFGRKHSEETKEKIGLASSGHLLSEEAKRKIGAAHKGKVVSDATRARMSASLKGRVISEEWRANMSAAKKGRVFTAEHRAKISEALKGRAVSEETRRKIGLANAKSKSECQTGAT